jgi:hypothetical protein
MFEGGNTEGKNYTFQNHCFKGLVKPSSTDILGWIRGNYECDRISKRHSSHMRHRQNNRVLLKTLARTIEPLPSHVQRRIPGLLTHYKVDAKNCPTINIHRKYQIINKLYEALINRNMK